MKSRLTKIISNIYFICTASIFMHGCGENFQSKRIVPCKELPESLKMFAKNCRQSDGVYDPFAKTFTYEDVEKYKKDLELRQIKQRLDEQETQIEMQRRIMIRDKMDMEENQNKPVFMFDNQSGQFKNCMRIGEMLSCN